MDFFVVAPLIQRSLEMFTSALGAWIPFALILVSTWVSGLVFAPKEVWAEWLGKTP
jgi:hypothetical protein